ncbi:MAG: hypothetical protein JXR52_10400 [Bacteroidales bacterium]|nr:hypothetical protein [Bacteroidales bacterium]MBN2699224.1 hypothetical protein [Bacteroidales bacterium]
MKKAPFLIPFFILSVACKPGAEDSINRTALVSRHNVVITAVDSLNALTVGNGDFAFTVDITGLQTFPGYHVRGIPLGTLSNWGWHTFPNDEKYSHSEVIRIFDAGGQKRGYYHDYGKERDTRRAKASSWLRQNPHRMNLGMIGLVLLDQNGNRIGPGGIENPRQELDLWTGCITSRFEVEGTPVEVVTVCHPSDDIVAVSIASELMASGRLSVELRFPAADPGWKNVALWGDDACHASRILESGPGRALVEHREDTTRYVVNVQYNEGTFAPEGAHRFRLFPDYPGGTLQFTCAFEASEQGIMESTDFESVRNSARSDWEAFWTGGGAVDFSECTDDKARELERRVVLSQYLTRIQCSGNLPPQETGLTFNSWFGKFHLEMHWWHAVHFALWQRPEILERQMAFYRKIGDESRALAEMQGYEGMRWPKMVGPDGKTSPSTVGNYLIWQQPHLIYFAELLFRTSGDTAEALRNYADLVFETARFMASFPVEDTLNNRYVLAPPLIPAQETFRAETTLNPAFELTYWEWALQTAITWKKRLGETVPAKWQEVADHLSVLSVQDSLYLFTENGTDSYSNERYLSDHPMVLGCMGVLPPSDRVDRSIMEKTFEKVVQSWNWPSTWGWDYPMVAMTAAELGKPEEAIRFLLLDVQKNRYLPNGHNYQDERLPLYLPGNGGLLTAVARICTKNQWPKDGTWEVKWENLNDF